MPVVIGLNRASTDEPRVGQTVVTSDWRLIETEHDTMPFKWGRAGEWLISWSVIDHKVKGIARKVGEIWVFRMRGGLSIRHRNPAGIIELFSKLQQNLADQVKH